ncbi:MAG: rhodanese-like domain-containing protein [Bacteroidia bacterium]|nr:rhodanese-like domain-containing protein [Bacteroidia bacterium]MDW8134851.1 rhodanese-like domain-containing protein [Bacteroidia bacterium]
MGLSLLGLLYSQVSGKQSSNTAKPLTISPTEAYKSWRASSEKVVILDVRTPQEYQRGHVKGARNIDYYGNFEEAIQKLPKDKIYYLHCASGRRSGAATEIMRKQGFEAYNMGGYSAVVEAGFPTE